MVSDIIQAIFDYLASTPPPPGVAWYVLTVQPQEPAGEILAVPGRCMMVLTEGGGDCNVDNAYRDMVHIRWLFNCTLAASRLSVSEAQFKQAVDAVLRRLARVGQDCVPPAGVSPLAMADGVSVQTGATEMRWLSMTDAYLASMKCTIEAWRPL